MPEDFFGEQVAEHYDDPQDELFQPAAVEPAVDVLAELAGDGAALELGIGTGRLALPLSRRGVPVHGIDLSPAMLAQLATKPGAERIGVTVGDFAHTRVPGSFTLCYLVFNTIMNLTSQDAQVACFANAAAHLSPGGHFLIEVMVPDLQRLPPGETVRPFEVSETGSASTPTTWPTRGWSHTTSLAAGRPAGEQLDPVSLCLAGRTGPDGPAGRPDACGTGGATGSAARSPATAAAHISVWQQARLTGQARRRSRARAAGHPSRARPGQPPDSLPEPASEPGP